MADRLVVTVRLEGDPPGWDDNLDAFRVPRALKHLVPGPLAGVWRTVFQRALSMTAKFERVG